MKALNGQNGFEVLDVILMHSKISIENILAFGSLLLFCLGCMKSHFSILLELKAHLVQIDPLGRADVPVGGERGLGGGDPRVPPGRAPLHHNGLIRESVHVQPRQRPKPLRFALLRTGRAQDLEELPHLI